MLSISNLDCKDFKSFASANWASGAANTSTGGEIRTLKYLILNQTPLPIWPSLRIVLRKGIEPLFSARKADVLTVRRTEPLI